MAQQRQQRHPSMPLLTVALMVLLAILMTASCSAAINVLPLRVDNPSPDGDGVVFIKLRADPADPAVGDLSQFQITSLNFLDGQVLKMWDGTNNNCDGQPLAATDYGTTSYDHHFYLPYLYYYHYHYYYYFKSDLFPHLC